MTLCSYRERRKKSKKADPEILCIENGGGNTLALFCLCEETLAGHRNGHESEDPTEGWRDEADDRKRYFSPNVL